MDAGLWRYAVPSYFGTTTVAREHRIQTPKRFYLECRDRTDLTSSPEAAEGVAFDGRAPATQRS